MAYVPFEATNRAIKLNIPTLVSNPFPEIDSIIRELASSGRRFSIKFIMVSIEMEKYAAITTTVVIIGIRAKTKKKAMLPGKILISGLLKVFNTFFMERVILSNIIYLLAL